MGPDFKELLIQAGSKLSTLSTEQSNLLKAEPNFNTEQNLDTKKLESHLFIEMIKIGQSTNEDIVLNTKEDEEF
jgi:hypothetical protein